MGMNIKSPRVHELARRAAERFGMSQTGVVEEALLRMLQDAPPVSVQRRVDLISTALLEIDASLSDDDRVAVREAAGALYDARGLPR
jgi:antitoxin VapB